MTGFSEIQRARLSELGADGKTLNAQHEDASARDAAYRMLERELIADCRKKLTDCLDGVREPVLLQVQDALSGWLKRGEGFTQVVTPTVINGDMLSRMTIDEENHLREQVYWVDKNRCLRPMLAPNLYIVMRDMAKAAKRPVKIFEAGSCFRKESNSSQHLSEFTMLNLVEYDTVKEGEQEERLEQLCRGAMDALGLTGYELKREASDVYGFTLDVEYHGMELASGAFGPHKLDDAWGVFTTWVGLGLGLERAAMALSGCPAIKRVARSTGCFNGAPLNL